MHTFFCSYLFEYRDTLLTYFFVFITVNNHINKNIQSTLLWLFFKETETLRRLQRYFLFYRIK